jgi:hypothetical protein
LFRAYGAIIRRDFVLKVNFGARTLLLPWCGKPFQKELSVPFVIPWNASKKLPFFYVAVAVDFGALRLTGTVRSCRRQLSELAGFSLENLSSRLLTNQPLP